MNDNASRRVSNSNARASLKSSIVVPLQDSDDEHDIGLKNAVVAPRGKALKGVVNGSVVEPPIHLPNDLPVNDENEPGEENGVGEEGEADDDDDDDDILSLFEDALEELGDEVLVNGGNGRF